MLAALTLLLTCQLVGEAITVGLGLPVPGPVIGMVLLFIGLCVKKGVPDNIGQTGGFLLSHLSILFVPAGVGIMVHIGKLQDDLGYIAMALVGSTLIGVGVTALVMAGLQKLTGRKRDPETGKAVK